MDPGPAKPSRPFPWTVAIFAAVTVVLAWLAFLALRHAGRGIKDSVDKGVGAVAKTVEQIPNIAAKFKTGTITHTFRAGIPEVASTRGDVLELAVARNDETVTRTDEKWVGWNYIYLGTTIAEIRVPVTFRYHLRLSDEWRLAARDQVCLVLAPRIRPSLPPAIHTDGMEKRAESGWARFDAKDQLAELEKSLTPMLAQRAGDTAHLSLVREACRQSVAEYVKKWLLREDHWRTDRFTAVVVVFPDEVRIGSDDDLARLEREPAIRFP